MKAINLLAIPKPLRNTWVILSFLLFSIGFSLLLTFSDPAPIRQFLGMHP